LADHLSPALDPIKTIRGQIIFLTGKFSQITHGAIA